MARLSFHGKPLGTAFWATVRTIPTVPTICVQWRPVAASRHCVGMSPMASLGGSPRESLVLRRSGVTEALGQAHAIPMQSVASIRAVGRPACLQPGEEGPVFEAPPDFLAVAKPRQRRWCRVRCCESDWAAF